MKKWTAQFNSLRFQILVPIVVIVLITFAMIIFPSSCEYKSSLTEQGVKDIKALAEALFGGIKPAITTGDAEVVQQLLDEVRKNRPDIEVAVIRYDGLVRQNTLHGENTDNLFKHLNSEDNRNLLEEFLKQEKEQFLQFEEVEEGITSLDVTMLLPNEQACNHCHGTSRKVLGALYISTPIQEIRDNIASFSRRNVIFGSIGIAVLVLLIYFVINSRVLKPIDQLVKSHKVIATGDLRHKIHGQFHGEVKELVNSFNGFVDQIVKMIRTVKDGCQLVSQLVDNVSATSHQFASGAEEQSAQSSEIAASVEEMTATIMETSQHTSNAAEMSSQASQKAREGSEAMGRTSTGFDNISNTFKDTQTLIQELAEKAKQIGAVTNVITEIAEQTNLLALNAAIEAARAGEMGRGFAVVADEVRKLAERTSSATEEIAKTIKSIQEDINKASESTGKVDKEILNGQKLVAQSEDILKEIDKQIQAVTDMIQQIAVASEEESSAASEISNNLELISSVSKESAQGATQLADTAEKLSDETRRLTEVVYQFKVNEKDN